MYIQCLCLNQTVHHQPTLKSPVCVLAVTCSKWIRDASIPPTSRPLAAHFPLQLEFIYWANWHPARLKCFSDLTPLLPSPNTPSIRRLDSSASKAPLQQQVGGVSPGCILLLLSLLLPQGEQLGLVLYTLLWGVKQPDIWAKENNVFTWSFLSEGSAEARCYTH